MKSEKTSLGSGKKKRRIRLLFAAGALVLVIALAAGTCLFPPQNAHASETSDEVLSLTDGQNQQETMNLVIDEADLLSDDEEARLNEKLNEISYRTQEVVVVLTTDTTGGKTSTEYADDYYDYHGFGLDEENSGVLLLVSMYERDWWISTTGKAVDQFTESGYNYISDRFVPYLSSGDYYKGFTTFADLADEFITHEQQTGEAYGSSGNSSEVMPLQQEKDLKDQIPGMAGGMGVISFFIALIRSFSLKRKLKSVLGQSEAGAYAVSGGANITGHSDVFLYHNLVMLPRVDSKSGGGIGGGGHIGSSGTFQGGGGGKF